ncbi:complement component receptor 1-like protein isoform X12 [Heteronotia binoei]|uniref:complement component receptor 1-like protein isoform X12 n=1 Tax=Heteronotia binoei TaxID=13085 RepID=UPI00292DDED2|nr:complement component receptor 1-like protein isoform X12 [Heteronotia binoei]
MVLLSAYHGDCDPPKRFFTARPKGDPKQSYPLRTNLTYTCNPGYEIIPGSRLVIECLENSEWSQIPEPCQGKRCRIPNIPNGRIVEDSELRFGDRITFACFEGHRPVGQNGAQCILQDNKVVWNNDPPFCERIPCLPPPKIANGYYNELRDYTVGTAVTYRCDNRELSLIGEESLTCISDQNLNGKWNRPAPECKAVSCRTPSVPNGRMITSWQSSYRYQHRVLFECDPGFKLKDNRGDCVCGADSSWQPSLPECVRGDTQTPELTTDGPGSSTYVPVTVGAAVAVIAVVAIVVAALKYRAHHKRQGKTVTGSVPESYTAVPHNTDISLEEKA